jgi:peptidyl-prolyl cis-trans isomerase D
MEKTRSAVILVFAVLMILSLVFFYAPDRGTRQGILTQSEETAAKVGGGAITVGEVATAKENRDRQNQMFGGRMPPTQAKQIVDGMISSKITAQEANRLGLYVSDQELADELRKGLIDSDGSKIDFATYEQRIKEQFGSVSKYEESVRESLARQKLEAFLTAGVSVSEAEVLENYKKQNAKFNVAYVPVSATALAASIKPTDEELKAYFEQNKANYYVSLPQKKIRYVFINQAKVGEKLEISEDDLKAEYDAMPMDRKQAGVQAQQIVLRISKPDFEEQVSKKANELVEQARKEGGKISEAAFGELAKGNSEDGRTAQNGGKLGGLVRPDANNTKDPLQRVIGMQEGEVTEPIKFGNAFYILRRGPAVPKTYEDAKDTIKVSLRNRRGYAAAAELAQKITDRLREVKDAQKVAEEFASQANMSAKDMVRETPFVKKDDDVPNIGVSPQFEQGIAALENPNDVGDKVPVKDGFAIPLLVEKKDPRDAEFDEVKDKVLETVKNDQARAKVEILAKEIAEKAGSTSALKSLGESKGLKPGDSKDFRIGATLGSGADSGSSQALDDAVYGLKPGEVSKTPVQLGGAWFVVGLVDRTDANMDEFAKQRAQQAQGMLSSKRSKIFSDYLADARRRMETNGQIKVYEDALKRIDEESAANEPEIPNIPPQG